MLRRKFFRVLGGLAGASSLLPAFRRKSVAHASSFMAAAGGVDSDPEDDAHFCATPAADRVFYALREGRIVSERLNEKTWQASEA